MFRVDNTFDALKLQKYDETEKVVDKQIVG